MQKKYPNVLSIAGVDPSGGAGLLADIKTISALEAYACGVVTAITAQNTRQVTAAEPVDPDLVAEQIDTLFDDVEIASVKIGMLFNEAIIETVADALKKWKVASIVLDPVMIAKSGDPLLVGEAIEALKTQLLPLSLVITPNLPEAECLVEHRIEPTSVGMVKACEELWRLKGGRGYVVLKGGHIDSTQKAEDFLFDGKEVKTYSAPRYDTANTHGTGCALSSAIAALIPQTNSVPEAFMKAKQFISMAIKYSDLLSVGSGHGPVMHFHMQWKVL